MKYGKNTKLIKLVVIAMFLMSILFTGGTKVFAAAIPVNSALLLEAYLSTGGDLIMTDDITVSKNLFVNTDTVLDLNGHTLNMGAGTLVPYGPLVIKDTSTEQTGKITGTAQFVIQVGSTNNPGSLILNSGTIDRAGRYGIRISEGTFEMNGGAIHAGSFAVYNSGNVVMNGGEIISDTGVGVRNNANATLTMNDGLIKTNGDSVAVNISQPGAKFTMNGGKVEALYHNEQGTRGGNAVAVFKDGEVVINGGDIASYGNAITGNGSGPGSSSDGSNAKITINGGAITAEAGAGIYAPQINGQTNITGGTITGITGIEIRAGELNVSGGSIIGTAEYEVSDNANGLATKGASISAAQHTTAQPIIVNITGGVFEAESPISVANPLEHPDEIYDKVEVMIAGGVYEGERYDDVIENIADGYVDYDRNGVVYVVTPEEADEMQREDEEGGQQEREDRFLAIPNTGRQTFEDSARFGVVFDVVTQIATVVVILSVITGITIKIYSNKKEQE